MAGRMICFQLGCTLFLFGGCTKRWIQFQDMLLMQLKLKHVSDWRTKTPNQTLLQRWPGLKHAHSFKHRPCTKRELQTRPLQSILSLLQHRAAWLTQPDFSPFLSRITACFGNVWHIDKLQLWTLMISRDVKAKCRGYWNPKKLWRLKKNLLKLNKSNTWHHVTNLKQLNPTYCVMSDFYFFIS